MAETKTYNGHVYTRNAPGEPWILSGPAQGAEGGGRQATIVSNPFRAKEEARRDSSETRDAARDNAELPWIAPKAAADVAKAQADAIKAQIEADKAKDTSALQTKRVNQRVQSDVVLKNIQEARDLITDGGTTGWRAGLAALPESRARRLRNIFDTIRANLTFDRLQQMRDESATGGAVGNASDADMRLLGATTGSLDQWQDSADLENVLNDVESRYMGVLADIEGVPRESFAQTYKAATEAASAGDGPFSPEQQRIYDAVMAANPSATAEQLRAALKAAKLPPVNNLAEIIAARDAGGGVRPGAEAVATPGTFQESLLGQGMSGLNEGIASTLGLPIDLMTGAMNLVPKGLNAVANTDIPTIVDPFLGGGWWKDRMDDIGAIHAPTDDGAGQFTRRVGQSLGSAVVPIGGAASTGRQAVAGLLSATGGGIGAATAQQVAPGNAGAEMVAELLGSGGVGLGAAAVGRRTAQREIESAIPTTQELKDLANRQYREAELNGITADPAMTQDMFDTMSGTLRSEGRISPTGRVSEVYPKVKEAYQLAGDYAGQPMTPTQLQTVRNVVADGRGSMEPAERRIASLLLDDFDGWSAKAVPGLDQARETASRYLTAGQLEKARELAGARAGQFTGSGFENALRTEYRALDRNAIKGRNNFSDPVLEAVENVSRGTPASNIARDLGKLAPTGVVSGALATGVPFTIGNAIGGPALGGALAAGTTGLGIAGRGAATRMGIRNAEVAELLARNGGKIDQAALIPNDTQSLIAALLAGQFGQQLGDDNHPQ